MAANAVFICVDFLPKQEIECKDVHKNEDFANFSEESWEKVLESVENGA